VSTDIIVTHVMAAVAVIIGMSYAVGLLFRRLRQPEVIGQLLAGIALGPSVLGRLSGHVSHVIFPSQIIPYLNVTSQVALVLFLFAVGHELDLRVLRKQRVTVPVIAAVTFAVPALLGILTAFLFEPLYRRVGEPDAAKPEFILFIGVAVSITAVPVLASIVAERGMSTTVPSVTALAAAALIDAVGWLILAGVLVLASVSSGGSHSWLITVAELACYVVIGVVVVRPLLRKWLLRPTAEPANYVPVAVTVAMASAWVTAALGLHAIFGAFFAGVIMPRQENDESAADLLRPVFQTGKLLLPIFFMVAGLSVNIGSLRGADWAVLGIVLVVAVLGKLGAGFVACRWAGFGVRDSAVVGTLLNTRGLTELIALNIGLSAGIIHQELYTALVLMALLTTMATGPLLSLFARPTLTMEQPVPVVRVAGLTRQD
jgi:Kef-type K+ transport system membrane component KefB